MGNNINNIYYKSEATLPPFEEIDVHDGYLLGSDDGKYLAKENGLLFHADWIKGQKQDSLSTSGKIELCLNTILKDVRFSICSAILAVFFYALRGGAKLVHSVDSSAKAIELTKQNVELNFWETLVMKLLLKMLSNIWRNRTTNMI